MSGLITQRLHSSTLRRAVLVVVILVLTSAVPAAVAAADDPWEDDPLQLIAFRDEVSALYSSGQDVWEVWVCQLSDGSVPIDISATVAFLNAEVRPYFLTLSSGLYQPTFRTGGVVTSPMPEPAQALTTWSLDDCEERVAAATAGGVDGALIVANTDFTGGYSTIGALCPGYYPGYPYACPSTYPDSGRVVVVGGATVVEVPPLAQPRLNAVAHEIGHAIGWPHSFGGLTFAGGGLVSEYDNPMDLMSGGVWVTLQGYTLVINRYAAGWVAPTSVAFHRKGSFEYQIGSLGTSASQMLVLPTDTGSSVYQVIGARTPRGYDLALPAFGVEVYEIDQSSWVCELFESGEPDWPCFGDRRRTSQLPAVAGYYGTSHVHGVGSVFNVGNVTVEVVELVDGVYTLRVSGDAVTQRFVDDNGNQHEANIETIAAAGITLGCNPPLNNRYCPSGSVTRGQMASFLARAFGFPPASVDYFPDDNGNTHEDNINRIAAAGVTLGFSDGTYQPGGYVTRAQMGSFIARAMGLAPVAGDRFSDVSGTHEANINAIAQAGITLGCNPTGTMYCPDELVRRDQMASFLARALG